MTDSYPKRLIEVDLPIKRISAHARREKFIRHGHISTLHIWWARRPLAACRAVLCAALWPDPADEHCPPSFREAAAKLLQELAFTAASERGVADLCDPVTWGRLAALRQPEGELDPANPDHLNFLRFLLLDFIADFANWDASVEPHYLATARALTQAAHEALGGMPGTRPLVVDPFAGGGAIPLEALRVGADAFASDLNPVAVLLNKVVLEYIPKYGQRLADEVRKWGEWIQERAEEDLAEFYPQDPDGATPIAYVWARTITCEGPSCGAEVPLMRGLWLAKRSTGGVALRMVPDASRKRVDFEILENAKTGDVGEGTIRRGSATCPICGYTTPSASARKQLKQRFGGTKDARLLFVVTTRPEDRGRAYRLPMQQDIQAVEKATGELERRTREHQGLLSLVPDEVYPDETGSGALSSSVLYGVSSWGDLFTPRQALALTSLANLVQEVSERLNCASEKEFADAVQTSLALVVDRVADRSSSLCRYDPSPTMSGINNTFARQALPMVWDFGEGIPISERSGSWKQSLGWLLPVLEHGAEGQSIPGVVERASAMAQPLPDDSAYAFVTDPPYYDAIAYGDLSDFFYVWLRRTLKSVHPLLLSTPLTDKNQEIVYLAKRFRGPYGHKTKTYFEEGMRSAMQEGRRILAPDGIGVVVFAHKSTSGWEAQLQAMIDAGWIITGSWPIDTEMPTKVAAIGQARLMSSVHIACRPRENSDGSLRTDTVGEWRDVLNELPSRIHQWMPRLAREGIVGADAVFACLGPALEIYSRYSRVERADGTAVLLSDVLTEKGRVVERGYLSYVWEAVSKEALSMIFEDADTAGFEADARLTAMWLWTLSTANGADAKDNGKVVKSEGYSLEYDAARKIAQGLGAHLEQMGNLVQVKGDKAQLLPVAERAGALFGRQSVDAPRGRRPADAQLSMFEFETEEGVASVGDLGAPPQGATVLDRVHQAMLLFATGRSEALRRFLVEEGAGQEARFWGLAQALSALYPAQTDEKRWVDGVLARKKGLGF